jgi:hypothetical protein
LKKTLFGSLDAVKLGNYSLNGPSGKKSASGTVDSFTSGTVTYADGVTTASFNMITVSGLGFTPTKIIAIFPAGGSLVVYNADQPLHSSYPDGKIGMSSAFNSTYNYEANLRNIIVDGTVAYVNATGFRLPHLTSVGLIYWWAFE